MDSRSSLTDFVRDRIVSALYMGHLHAGDRLPSIREVSGETGKDHRAVARAYRALEAEGLVRIVPRSGIYVAEQERLGGELLAETARWMAGVLVEAWRRRITVSELPELVRRCTTTVRLHCACVESTEDLAVVLCTELREDFGLESRPVRAETLPAHGPGQPVRTSRLPEEIREVDFLVSTTFHAGAARAVAEALEKPLVVATVNPDIVAAIERRLRERSLTVVCVDPRFGDRVRSLRGGAYRDRIHIVLADDAEAVAALDPSEPVFLTRAAHQQLGEVDVPLLIPLSPSISPESARELAEVIIRLNVRAERQSAG